MAVVVPTVMGEARLKLSPDEEVGHGQVQLAVEAESAGVFFCPTMPLYTHVIFPGLPVSTNCSYSKVVTTESETPLEENPGNSGMHVTGSPLLVPPH